MVVPLEAGETVLREVKEAWKTMVYINIHRIAEALDVKPGQLME